MARTILIVDDSRTERVVLQGFLKGEYDTLEAGSGEEALQLLRKHFRRISAIVMDVIMPGMDGFDTLKQLKLSTAWQSIPVIITTGLDDEEARERAISCGADNFITKPFNQKLLLHVVGNAIRLRETAAIANTLWRDSLTGLLNKESFYSEAARMIKRQRDGYYILSGFDVENFKIINDQYGTHVGDEVLKHVAGILNGFAAENNGLACHYTADKFAVLFPARVADSDAVARYHERMMNPPCLGRRIRIRVGRYPVTDRKLPVSAMFDRASMAEESVKGRFDVFRATYTEAMRDELLREQQIVNDMVGALQNGEFEPWFQPQYNHATGALIGAEALARWRRDGKIVPPNSFIPVFERNGFIYEVDQSVWRQVCALLRGWLDAGKHPVPVSVNISRYDLYQKDFLDVITGLVAEYNLPADLLRLEITESAFADTAKAVIHVANELIARGFTVEIDDFGSGYSSLNTLKDVPASILKLDVRFFEASENSQRGGNIVESIVRMAKWINMAVIAEGVEEQAQADYLKSIGCYYIQGYFYAKPMPRTEYEALLDAADKEPKLSRLRTLATLDNNEFWNPKSMETLIFNSYVGGACIFELCNGKAELLRVNDQYRSELGGLLPEGISLKDSSVMPFLDEAGKATLFSAMREAIDQKRESVREGYLRDGDHVEFLRLTMRLIARSSERYLFYAVIVNMTEQRRAEQAALNASQRVTAIMNSSQCGITAVAVHADGSVEYLFVNERFFEMLGYTRAQFGREVENAFGCIHPDDYDRVVAETLAITEVGQTATLQMRGVRRDQRVIWLRADVSIVRFDNVPYPVQLSNFMDITDQVAAQKRQLESAEQLEAIMGNVNGSVSAFLLNDMGNTTLIFGNDRYYGIFGYTREQAEEIHLDTMSCVVPEDYDMVLERLNRLKADGMPAIVDFRATKRDGSLVYIRANCSRMSMEGYGNQVIVSVETDITEKRTLEEQLRAIVDNINGGVSATYLIDGKTRFALVNAKYFEIIGYTREQFEAEVDSAFAIVHPGDRERVEALFREAAVNRQPYTMEYRIRRRNGAIRHILCNTSVIQLFGMDEPVQLAVSNDITVLRETQQKERDLSLQISTIMGSIRGGVVASIVHDRDDVEIVFANDGFYAMYGYTKEQLAAELPSVLDLILPEDRPAAMETVERILRERGSETYEYRCRRRDGSIIWTQVTNAVISMEGVGDTVLLAIVTDFTALRQAELEKLSAANRLQTVMNVMSNGMSAVTFHGDRLRFLFANDRYFELHNASREQLDLEHLGASLAQVYPDDRERVRQVVLQTNAVGQRAQVEYRVLRPDGTVRWLKATLNVTSLIGEDAPVQVTVYADVSAERIAADQLRYLNESAHDILSQPDSDAAIRQTLRGIIDYFKADRGYVVELDGARHASSHTYEICAEGVASAMARLQSLAFAPDDIWYQTLSEGRFLIIGDVSALPERDAALRELLLAQGIRSIIVAPLKRDGRLIGFVGVDNPTNAVDQARQLTALSDYVSILLNRRDLKRRIDHDHQTLRQLVDDTPGGFLRMQIRTDKHPAIVDCNDGFCRMLGMTRGETMSAYGADVFQCLLPEDIAAISASSSKALAGSGQFTERCRLLRKDGSRLFTTVFGRFARDESGALFLNAYFTDITERVDAERQQIELLDNLPAGAALYEYVGGALRVIHINRRYWQLVGREPVNYREASVMDVVHPSDRALITQELESAIRQKRNVEIDVRIRAGADTYRPFHITATIRDRAEGGYLLYVAYTPISDETMSVQQMLPVALSTMIAATEDISYVKDKDLRYIAVSQSVADMAGYANPRDLVGKSAEEVFAARFAGKFAADDRRILETGVPAVNVLEHLPTAEGNICLARTSKFPILDTTGNAVGVYCVSHDVTAQKEKESQLELLTSSIPGGLAAYSISKEGFTTLYFNEGYYAYSGYTREEYIAMTDKEPLALMLPEDRPQMLALVRSFAAEKRDGMTGGCTYRCLTKDGDIRWMNLRAVLSRVGEDAYVLNAVQLDITDQMELQRRREELTNRIPGGIATFYCRPGDIRLAYYNEGLSELSGYPRDERSLEGASPLGLVFAEDRHTVEEQLGRMLKDGATVECAFRIHTKDGGWKWVSCKAAPAGRAGTALVVYAVLTDITEQQEEKERLRLAEEAYRIATRHSNRTICRYNVATSTITVAEEAATRLALPETIRDVPYGRVKLGKISKDTAKAYIAFFEAIKRGERERTVTFEKHLNNGWRWIEARATTLFDSAGKPVSAIISYTDVTEQREKEAVYSRWQNSLKDRPEDSYALFRCNLSRSASYDSWSGKLLRIEFDPAKQTFDERTSEYIQQCVYAEDRERYRAFMRADTMLAEYYRGHRSDSIEYRECLPDGGTRWLRLTVDLVEYPDSNDVEAYLMYENIDAQKRSQLRTLERAETDPLTGVLNRATFAVRVNQLISLSKQGARHAMLMLDVDSFKQVNDVFGHGVGDQALSDIAALLTRNSRKGDLVGRLGGDEFLIFLTDIAGEADAAKKARQICELTRRTFNVEVRISASIGIAMYPQDGEGFETLYKAADETLYRVKDTGKNDYMFSHDRWIEGEETSDAPVAPRRLTERVRRMLIVEGEAADHRLLEGLFRDAYRIERASDGATALAKLRHYGMSISVALLDLSLPGMSGAEVLRRMQMDEGLRGIPVIAISDDSRRETMLSAIRAGALDYAAKPFDTELLRLRVESAVSKASNERQRAESSYRDLLAHEADGYQAALEHSGILVATLDWGSNAFHYSASMASRLKGKYDERSLWRIWLTDRVADAHAVQQAQQLVHQVAEERSRMEGDLTLRLLTSEGKPRSFQCGVFKEVNEFGLADRMIITLRELPPDADEPDGR